MLEMLLNDKDGNIQLCNVPSEYKETVDKKGLSLDICHEIISGYNILRERMANLRISKEEMKKYRLDFSEVRKMYFSAKDFIAAN